MCALVCIFYKCVSLSLSRSQKHLLISGFVLYSSVVVAYDLSLSSWLVPVGVFLLLLLLGKVSTTKECVYPQVQMHMCVGVDHQSFDQAAASLMLRFNTF